MGRGAIPGAVSVRKCLLEPPNFSKVKHTQVTWAREGNQSRARKGREASPGGKGLGRPRSERENMASGDLPKSIWGNSQLPCNGLLQSNAGTSQYS